ncbi:MAG: inositol monophosphatase family protein [Limisphaerales bacterium]
MNTKPIDLKAAQAAAVEAAQAVGALLRRNLHATKRADKVTQHDIKLELDVRSQKRIEKTLHHAFPDVALLGEEGTAGPQDADWRWVVDPIDGTVNFAYGIPHACVSIALQRRTDHAVASTYEDGYQTVVGVVYDPFCDELWTAAQGGPARLNGRVIHVSPRRKLGEAILSIGFSKTKEDLEATFPYFVDIIHRVRKMRIMGSAALALTYVACGRFDAYIERGIRIWDIAAGGFIVERAGGQFFREALGDHAYRMISSNGLLRRHLRVP